jgi:DNA-binding PucR family transcriptional regulator
MYAKYIAPVSAGGGPMADVLLETVDAFLSRNRGYQSTADALYVHVNTLRHRLTRYEELIGDSFGRTETAFEAWWAFRYARFRQGPAR